MKALFGKTFDMLSSVLDYRSTRQKVIAANVANLDTPDYRPSDIKFQDTLQAYGISGGTLPVTRTDPRHLPAVGNK